jgi:2-C-methyl-D-erythritol 2,4-cyclodiphosphate synthase
MIMFRIGIGTDIHRLTAGRPLYLGGVLVDAERGAEGHSDADALLHAVTDAIFGAIGEGDIGTHFPNSEDRWRNAESSVFLRYAVGMMKDRGYTVANLDSVIDLESPKLRAYIEAMRENLAAALETETSAISVKAKSGEGLDSVGEGRAVRAQATILITRS